MGLTRRFLHFYVVWHLLVSAISGCGNPTPPPPKKGVTRIEKPEVAGEQSLSSEQYIQLGLPPPDRNWSGDDMIKVEKVLSTLAQKGFQYLPRYQDERSGEVFARLTSAKNLEVFKNRNLPLATRMPQWTDHMQASSQITKLYLSASFKKQVGDSELVELFGMGFRGAAVMIELTKEFLPTIKKDDPTYKVRMQGLEGMKRGHTEMVMGGLLTLTERKTYRSSELLRLVGYMQQTFPVIVSWLPPGSRSEVMILLEKLEQDPAMNDLQSSLHKLRLKIQDSVEKKKEL